MVGIVVVSHSDLLAEGVVALAREMAGPELKLVAAGGMGEPGVLGTDAERVRAAIESTMSSDGVLVMMDLGSALMSAEFAVELLEDPSGPVLLCDAPLVEGAVAAAVAASGGAPLAEVAEQARGALAMKTAQLAPEDGDGAEPAAPVAADESPAGGQAPAAPDAVTELVVRNRIGIHARPAARLVELLRDFAGDVQIAKRGSGAAPVNARSLTNVVALGARLGDVLEVGVSGPQAQALIAALQELAASGFGDGIEPEAVAAGPGDTAAVAPAPPSPAAAVVPTVPTRAPAAGTVLHAVAASHGVAVGYAYLLGGGPAGPPPQRAAGSVTAEQALLEQALQAARAGVQADRDNLASRASEAEAAIFDAHLALLDDAALLDPARAAVAAGATAEAAWYGAAQQLATTYRGFDEPLLAERATDVLDIGQRLVQAIVGEAGADGKESGQTAIVIADELTPSQAARLDPERVAGIATARGSVTAHAAIIARALGVPAVVGLGGSVLALRPGTKLLLDGDAGAVTVAPPQVEVAAAQQRAQRDRERNDAALARAHEPGRLASGERIEILANIGNPSDAVDAVKFGAEGVGMLRTEFLYLDRPELPDEDEQLHTFAEIAQTLAGGQLIVRTLDAGADKPLPGVPMPPEANPFLGVRGIRVGLQQPELLRPQLRAALRAAAQYPVKLMMPMVATLGELRETRRMIDEARADLGIDAPMELGITLEVPAAAVLADQLAAELDFFSLGTNDLTQYTMAAERGDARLAELLADPQPAVLRLVRTIVDAAHARTRPDGRPRCWVGICGEMAGDTASAILLAGLGVDELSVSPRLVPELKAVLRSVTLADARTAAAQALAAPDAASARKLALALL
jgi:phosphocarrier protein FPr